MHWQRNCCHPMDPLEDIGKGAFFQDGYKSVYDTDKRFVGPTGLIINDILLTEASDSSNNTEFIAPQHHFFDCLTGFGEGEENQLTNCFCNTIDANLVKSFIKNELNAFKKNVSNDLKLVENQFKNAQRISLQVIILLKEKLQQQDKEMKMLREINQNLTTKNEQFKSELDDVSKKFDFVCRDNIKLRKKLGLELKVLLDRNEVERVRETLKQGKDKCLGGRRVASQSQLDVMKLKGGRTYSNKARQKVAINGTKLKLEVENGLKDGSVKEVETVQSDVRQIISLPNNTFLNGTSLFKAEKLNGLLIPCTQENRTKDFSLPIQLSPAKPVDTNKHFPNSSIQNSIESQENQQKFTGICDTPLDNNKNFKVTKTCKFCLKNFDNQFSQKQLKRHESHCPARSNFNTKVQCEHCFQFFNNSSGLRNHQRAKHKDYYNQTYPSKKRNAKINSSQQPLEESKEKCDSAMNILPNCNIKEENQSLSDFEQYTLYNTST